METFLSNWLPFLLLPLFIWVLFVWQVKRNKPKADEYVNILKQRNELAAETNKILKEICSKLDK